MTTDPDRTALDVLGTLLLEDGRLWMDRAYDFQLDDATAILAGTLPYHFLTRPRGASKTTDLAGMGLALLLTAAARERLYWLAADRDQGGLAIDAIAGFTDRTPALRDALVLTTSAVEVRATGARLDVLPADAASSWGLRPFAVFCDEISQWPETAGPQRLWDSVSSAVAKRSDAKLIVLSTAGDPAHFSRTILDHAVTSPLWRVHEVPGPSPWMDPDRLAEQKARLLPSMYARLFENKWVAGEDRLASPEELAACVTLDGPLAYSSEHTYTIAADLGLKRDRTAIVVAHLEGRVVTVDRIAVWQGTRTAPVELQEVEKWILSAADLFGGARVVADPYQGVGLLQRLRSKDVEAEEFLFTAQSVGRLAAALFNAIRDKAIALPPDDALMDELLHVRLRESSPGVFRLDHDAGRHDDRAIALALATTTLLQDEVSARPFAMRTITPPAGTPAGDWAREMAGAGYDPDSFAAEDAEDRGGLASGVYSPYNDSPLDDW